MLVSCHPAKQISNTNTAIGQTLTNIVKHLDSIYVYQHDSIYTLVKGDTIYTSKYITRYRDRWHIKTDSILKTDTLIFTKLDQQTKTLEVEKKLSLLQIFLIWWGSISLAIAILFIIVTIAQKIKK
jgi:hypothetical protein